MPAATVAALQTALATSLAQASGSSTGTVDWTFAVADQNLDFLGATETLTITYQVSVHNQNNGGDTATVFSPPYHPYTELLLSSVPEMRPDWLDEVLAARATGAARTSALLRAP